MSRALMALMFFPRGGSAQVARYLARSLSRTRWDVSLVAGSLGAAGEETNAATFFEGLDVRAVDYTQAREADDPLLADPPFHPSFEDRQGAPDRVFASVDDNTYEHLVATWERVLDAAGAASSDVLHLHHLTPMNEAAARSFADVPVVGHLHGTELLMLARIDAGAPTSWKYAEVWADRMRRWARACERLLVLSPDAVKRVPDLLGVDPARVVWAPNGFDPELFERLPLEGVERKALWRDWLVENGRGWDESGEPGTVRYAETDLDAFDGRTLVYVGRYTEVKRIPLMIRAFSRARKRSKRAALVLLGGHPGEWEGPHPLEVIRETGAEDVFLAGWRGHDDLARGLNASDAVVLASVHEQFGQVLVEGMACGIPAVAVDAHGPATIVDDGRTGWLVPPDDEGALADALVEVIDDDAERRRRGDAAYEVARERYSWPALAESVAEVYDEVERVRAAGE